MDTNRLYTAEEDAFIRQHYTAIPHRDIADKLGRTVKSIRSRAEKIGCPKIHRCRRWSEEDDEFILASKGRPLADVARTLGRDKSDTLKRAKHLGFKSWKRPDGGNYVDSNGYEVRRFDHGKPILEHRAVVEECIGRQLTDRERVHHIDLDKRNNRPENPHLFPGPSEHARCHNELNALVGKGADVAELLRVGTIYFDRNKGVYR